MASSTKPWEWHPIQDLGGEFAGSGKVTVELCSVASGECRSVVEAKYHNLYGWEMAELHWFSPTILVIEPGPNKASLMVCEAGNAK